MKIRRSLARPGALSFVPGACSDDGRGGGGSSPDAVSIEAFAAFIESEAGIAMRTEAGYLP